MTEFDKVLDYGKMLEGLGKQIAKNFGNLCGKHEQKTEKYEECEVVNVKNYTWKDIVKIVGKLDQLFCEEFPISGEMYDKNTYKIGDFIRAVAEKHGVEPEEVDTYMLGADISGEIEGSGLAFGPDECGCYINGVAEWLVDGWMFDGIER